MRMHPSVYPVFGLVQMIIDPQLLVKTLGALLYPRMSERATILSLQQEAKYIVLSHLNSSAGLLVMEILIPVFWLSDSLVEGHHKQVSYSCS